MVCHYVEKHPDEQRDHDPTGAVQMMPLRLLGRDGLPLTEDGEAGARLRLAVAVGEPAERKHHRCERSEDQEQKGKKRLDPDRALDRAERDAGSGRKSGHQQPAHHDPVEAALDRNEHRRRFSAEAAVDALAYNVEAHNLNPLTRMFVQ
jgi:hypothetical protein